MLSFVAGVVSSFGRRRLIGDDKLLETIKLSMTPSQNRTGPLLLLAKFLNELCGQHWVIFRN